MVPGKNAADCSRNHDEGKNQRGRMRYGLSSFRPGEDPKKLLLENQGSCLQGEQATGGGKARAD